MARELLRGYVKACSKGNEEAAKNILKVDLSEMVVCMATGPDSETVYKGKAFLDV